MIYFQAEKRGFFTILYDVIVVGGGPTGSYTARNLSEAGYSVLVLERRKKMGGRVCCTGIISQNCLDTFHIDGDLIQRKVNSATIYSPSGKKMRLWRRENQACIIDRALFDKYMAEKAQEVGVKYLFKNTVEEIITEIDHVTVKTDSQYEYKSRVAVIAGGFGSKLTKKLGLNEPVDCVFGAQIDVNSECIDETEVFTGKRVAPGFFAWLVPTLPNRALAGLLSRNDPKGHLKKLLFALKNEGKIDYDDREIDCRGITIKPLTKTYGQRFIVVGDAAGQVKPTTGGGIYFGLLSAEIAVRNLKKALKENNFSARSLSRYQREWKNELWQELKVCYWARKLYERLSDQQIDRIFEITTASGIDRAFLEADDISFDWHGKAILRFTRQQAMIKSLKVIKVPLKFALSRKSDDR
ncbi:MAG: NAD(P)/FAD-dependent oxidoreductase [Dehalococcoidia bacterium]|nr:MAG: NAD(P)/FAD-dependent oxidoreductase [Dehalococcoidia bacterium]